MRFAQLDREDVDTSGDDDTGAAAGAAAASSAAAHGVLENAGLSFADLEKKARTMKSRYTSIEQL